MLHPKVVDPENWPQVYGVFTFSTDATRLQERLAGAETRFQQAFAGEVPQPKQALVPSQVRTIEAAGRSSAWSQVGMHWDSMQ